MFHRFPTSAISKLFLDCGDTTLNNLQFSFHQLNCKVNILSPATSRKKFFQGIVRGNERQYLQKFIVCLAN